MANEKMTKRDYFTGLIKVVESTDMADKADYIAFLDRQIELLDKKATSTKPTKTQQENVETMELILTALRGCSEPITITDLQAQYPELSEYSNQKLSALMKKLVDSEKAVKIVSKRRSYFAAATVNDTKSSN